MSGIPTLIDGWMWPFLRRHLWGTRSRPAVRWMNRLAFLGLAVGVFSWASVMSVMRGLQGQQKERILAQEAHLLWEGTPRKDLAQRESAIREILGENLLSQSFVLQTEALLERPNPSAGALPGAGVVVQGLDTLPESSVEVGGEIMDDLNLFPGAKIDLRSPWRMDKAPLSLDVTRAFYSGVYEIDQSTVRVSRKRLEQWLGLEGAVSRIEIRLHNPMQAAALQKTLHGRMPDLVFKSWEETHASLWYSLRLEEIVMGLTIFFIILLAALAVHMALSVRVAEKTREIALLRALGAPAGSLARLYLAEGFLLGACGAFLGLALAYAFCFSVGRGQWLQLPDFFYIRQVPVKWDWGVNLGLTFLALLAAVWASWGPARRVLKIEIQDALRA